MNVPQSNDTLHLMTFRGSAFYEFFSSHCFLNSLWSTLFSCLASVQLLGHRLLVMVVMKRVSAWGGMEGNSSFPSSPPIYPPTCLSPITFLSFHLFFLLLLPPSSSSPGDTWFSRCHQLLPLSLSPDFPDPYRTKLSLRVS